MWRTSLALKPSASTWRIAVCSALIARAHVGPEHAPGAASSARSPDRGRSRCRRSTKPSAAFDQENMRAQLGGRPRPPVTPEQASPVGAHGRAAEVMDSSAHFGAPYSCRPPEGGMSPSPHARSDHHRKHPAQPQEREGRRVGARSARRSATTSKPRSSTSPSRAFRSSTRESRPAPASTSTSTPSAGQR